MQELHNEDTSPQRRSIQEFRIDFLLEEEFACNIDYLRSFVERCGLAYEPQSLPEVTHESRRGPTWIDLLVEFRVTHSAKDVRLALLVEDKITAPPQPYQAERYKRVVRPCLLHNSRQTPARTAQRTRVTQAFRGHSSMTKVAGSPVSGEPTKCHRTMPANLNLLSRSVSSGG
jgi:hypothetical protein